MSVGELADATPASRDRYVDFLRAFSIAVVVIGHLLIAVIHRRPDHISVDNAVGRTSGLWLATWVLQVMPLFFFVGGFSNLRTLDAGRGSFFRTRLVRLLRPFAPFAAVWFVVEVVLHGVVPDAHGVFVITRLPFGPLWFLVVYLAVVLVAPAMLRLHRRFGWSLVIALLAVITAIDVARFAFDVGWVGWFNLALVWLLVHQLGFFYGDGTLAAWPRVRFGLLAVAGLAGLVLLTNLGPYPRSMVGVDQEAVSNMSPPTLCIVALTFWQVGLAMLARPTVNRWLARRGPWSAVIAANSMIMTVFLWHLTALLLTIILLGRLGIRPEPDTTAAWWATRPLWIGLPLVILVPFVAVFGRVERPRRVGDAEAAPLSRRGRRSSPDE